MPNAKKLPSGNWRILLYDGKDRDGKRIYQSFTAPSKKEAEYMAAEYALNHQKKPEDMTVGEAIDEYIASRDKTMSVSSVRSYKNIRKNALGALADVKIRNVTEIALQNWANCNAPNYAPKTIRTQYGLICAALKQHKVKLEYTSILLKPKQKSEYVIPDKAQMSAIVQAVSGTAVEVPVLLALMLGLRQSEIAGLAWSDYDGSAINIHGAKLLDENNKMVYKDTNKSYAGRRVIDVPSYLAGKLDEEKTRINPKDDDPISPMLSSSVLRAFQRICKAHGLPPYKMHALRHANASLMLVEGVADKYAMERLGQSTTNMLKTIYQHTFEPEQKEVSKKMDSTFSSLVKPQCNTKCNTIA